MSYLEILDYIKNKHVELRHDVDLSLQSAYKMSKIEYSVGIKSIYYVRFDSDYYNVLSQENEKIINYILTNHEIGCHVDVTNLNNEKDLTDYLNKFKKIINFNKFTFHINTPKTKSFGHVENFINKSILYNDYISDSNGIFTLEKMNKIKESDNFTLLIHPEWWDNDKWLFTNNSVESLISSLELNKIKKNALKEILNKDE